MYTKLTSLDRVWGEHRALSYIQIRYPIYLPEESCINNNCNFYWYFIKDSFPHHVTTVLYQKCWPRLIFLPSSYWTEILTSGIVFLSLLFFLLMMDISRYILHFWYLNLALAVAIYQAVLGDERAKKSKIWYDRIRHCFIVLEQFTTNIEP